MLNGRVSLKNKVASWQSMSADETKALQSPSVSENKLIEICTFKVLKDQLKALNEGNMKNLKKKFD